MQTLPSEVKTLGPHKYGCLMAVLPDDIRKEITDWTIENVLDCHLSGEGRELTPHITILYGFTEESDSQLEAIKTALLRVGPFNVKLGALSLFKGGKDGDVLKCDVESWDLRKLNAAFSIAFPHADKYPEYIPHVTLAYLDPSAAELYAEELPPFCGKTVRVESAEWSGADGNREILPMSVSNTFARFANSRETFMKTLSAYNETSGGALVPPPALARNRKIKTLREKYKGWVTLEPSGTHVYIENGEITKGPAAIVNKKPSEIDKNKIKQPKADKTPLRSEKPKNPKAPPTPKQSDKKPDKVTGYDVKPYGRSTIEDVKKGVADYFGSEVTVDALGQAVGAPANAKIFSYYYRGELVVHVETESYTQKRSFSTDSYGKKYITNETFFMKEGASGKGLGANVFAAQVQNAADLGISYLETQAARDEDMNGYYTWARFGYDAPLSPGNFAATGTFQKMKKEFPNAKMLSDVMATKKGRDWWKENGCTFEGKFDLSPESKSMKIFKAYQEERNNRAG